MPLKVRRFYTSIFTLSLGLAGGAFAQTQPSAPPQGQTAAVPQTAAVRLPTSAEVMRDRISKAKAYIAVRNYSAAIYELENIRRETSDPSVHSVTNILLMNSYLEQGEYKRAENLLNEFYNAQKVNKPNAASNYSAVASQIVKGARSQVERYRGLGLTVSDRNLPLEAVNDVERMRELVELVVTQAKELGKDRSKVDTAVPLLEEATTSRSLLARDDYDARRWRDEAADSREQLARSRSVVINAVDGSSDKPAVPQPDIKTVAATTGAATEPAQKGADSVPVYKPMPVATKPLPNETVAVNTAKPPVDEPKKSVPPPAASEPQRNRVTDEPTKAVAESKATGPAADPQSSKTDGPVEVGSLIAYATRQQAPTYPPAARSMRATGVVKVELTVDENGDVVEVQNASGHSLLQTAAKDAVRRWKFKPFVRDGQPVRAVGFVNFNFSL